MTKKSTWILIGAMTAAALTAGCVGGDDPAYTPTERQDTETIPIPAGAALEYKLYLRAGDPLEYDWFATDFLFFDFHGEEDGAPPDEFTSHKTGELRTDRGEFVAPFAGTHGWYWSNRSSADVQVTLTTEGVYAVVGFV